MNSTPEIAEILNSLLRQTLSHKQDRLFITVPGFYAII